uniref:C2H2-type domain-containing protein n=1 Tax=Ditylenchus dipsaci TaxID=166011 RepID=A0A915DUM6_9BILA
MNLQPVGENHVDLNDEDGHQQQQMDCFLDNTHQNHPFTNDFVVCADQEGSKEEVVGTLNHQVHFQYSPKLNSPQQNLIYRKPNSQLQRTDPPNRVTRDKRKGNNNSSSSSSQHLDNIINGVAERSSLQQEPPLIKNTGYSLRHWQDDHLESSFDYSEHVLFPSKSGVNYVDQSYEYEDQLTVLSNYGQEHHNNNYEYFECVKDGKYEEEQVIPTQCMLGEQEGEGDDGQTTLIAQDFGRKGPTTKFCDFCGLFLRHPSKIAAHMRTHTGEKPFLCDICGQDFSQRTPYRMHMKRHLGDLPFTCTLCSKKFPNKASRNGMSSGCIGDYKGRAHRNHISSLTSTRSLQQHRSAIVNWQPPLGDIIKPTSETALRKITSVVESVAAGCNATTATVQRGCPSALERNSRDHRQRPPTVAQCTDCGLIFKHPSKIQAHMRTHTGEKPFLCDECGLGCSTNSALRVHIRRFHTSERPHECTWDCGMKFVSVAARNEHERIVHAGIKR